MRLQDKVEGNFKKITESRLLRVADTQPDKMKEFDNIFLRLKHEIRQWIATAKDTLKHDTNSTFRCEELVASEQRFEAIERRCNSDVPPRRSTAVMRLLSRETVVQNED